ncbi:MAG: glycosyltransferase [Vicinamibacterales bacterium]
MANRSLRILHAIHAYPPHTQAGAAMHTHALAQAQIEKGHQATVLCADYDLKRAHGHLESRVHEGVPIVEITNNWVSETFVDTYVDAVIGERVRHVLEDLKPDVVHVHNLRNLTFDLPRLARNAGARVVATLHDHDLVCASAAQRLHGAESHLCVDIDTSRCARCFSESTLGRQAALGRLKSKAGGALSSLARAARAALPLTVARLSGRAPSFHATQADLEHRRDAARAVYANIDLFVTPSSSLGREYEALGLPAQKLLVSGYGMPSCRQEHKLRTTSARMRIGFIGTPIWRKGVHVLLDAVRRLPANAVDLTIVGDRDVSPEYAAHLAQRAIGLRVTFTGRVPHQEVGRQFSRLDVLVVPSLCLEGALLVIHEAFAAGVPVVGSNLGGIPDLVQHDVNGLLFTPGDAQSLAHELRRLLADPDLLPRLSAGRPTAKSVEDDANEWEQKYASRPHDAAWSEDVLG